MAKIYTKTGDSGETSLFGGDRVSKSDLRIASYGDLDELNSAIGIVVAQLGPNARASNTVSDLIFFQSRIFDISSHLACLNASLKEKLPILEESWISILEKKIDEMTSQLPELKNFILPGGSLESAQLHLARTICRRAERQIVELQRLQPADDIKFTIRFLNRLSDYLFVLSRYLNSKNNYQDILWKSK